MHETTLVSINNPAQIISNNNNNDLNHDFIQELQRQTSLNIPKEEGFASLRIKAKNDEFTLPPNL
jgi:hypothetical protein